MTTHTPGPWYADPNLETVYARTPSGDHILIADLWRASTCKEPGVVTANTALIAAAPELLAVCQYIAKRWSLEDPGMVFPGHALRGQLEAAIAKATGGSQ